MRTVSWNKFDGGMTTDPREPAVDVCRILKHFDDYTRSYKLSPHRSMIVDARGSNEAALEGYNIKKFVLGNGTLYGVGLQSGNSKTQIYTKITPGDPTDAWTAAASAASSNGAENFVQPVCYHNYIYGVGTQGIWKYGDISGSPSFTYNDYTSNLATAQGIVHSKDDILYFPSNNKILANNAGSWSNPISFPTNCIINSICEYGNYLAVAADQPDGTCTVYLWDRNASLATLPEIIHWGAGSLKLIEVVAGVLCGVSVSASSLSIINPRLMFKYYSGTEVKTIKEFVCSLITINNTKQVYNNLFYFLAEVTIDGTALKGVWKVFKNPSGALAVSFDRLPRNDVAITAGNLFGFYRWGDYMFVAYGDPTNSNTPTVWRTDNNANFTATSIYETIINPIQPERYRTGAGTRSELKSLVAVSLGTEVLTTGQQVKLQYRVDGGSWITIATVTYQASPTPMNSNVVHEYNVDSNGNAFQNGREYEFHLESTGGAEITEFKYKHEELETKL